MHITRPTRLRALATLLAASGLAGCSGTSGIIPLGPDTFTLSEMRAPAIGGGTAAHQAVLAEAAGFCQRHGKAVLILDGHPDGDPYTPYYPTAYDVTFRCR